MSNSRIGLVGSRTGTTRRKFESLEGIKYLLNYFEFVAVGIRAGDLDEKTMRMSLRSPILTLVDMSEAYIKFSRGELSETDGYPSNTAYEHVLWLRARWKA